MRHGKETTWLHMEFMSFKGIETHCDPQILCTAPCCHSAAPSAALLYTVRSSASGPTALPLHRDSPWVSSSVLDTTLDNTNVSTSRIGADKASLNGTCTPIGFCFVLLLGAELQPDAETHP